MTPILRLAAGDTPARQGREIFRLLGVPILAIAGFLLLWGALAPQVQISLGTVPGPVQVWQQVEALNANAMAEHQKA